MLEIQSSRSASQPPNRAFACQKTKVRDPRAVKDDARRVGEFSPPPFVRTKKHDRQIRPTCARGFSH